MGHCMVDLNLDFSLSFKVIQFGPSSIIIITPSPNIVPPHVRDGYFF